MVSISDTELLKASLAGNRDSFGQIVGRYQSLICAVTYSSVGDLGLSEDIAQETFIAAWEQLGTIREPEKFRAWLCGIAHNLVRVALKQRKRNIADKTQLLGQDAEIESAVPGPPEYVISKEEQEILWRTLSKIPENYREPLILFYREQQSVKNVAQLLDLSEDTVKQRLSRGRKMLKAQMAAFVEETLSCTGPAKSFVPAVLAVLTTTKAKAMAAGTTVVATKGSLSSTATFWIALGNTLAGALLFLLTKGYITLFVFIALTAYLLLRKPNWYENKKARVLMTAILCLILGLLMAIIGSVYYSLLFFLLGLIPLFALHPGCPENAKLWLIGAGRSAPLYPWKKWGWQTPPKNWKSTLCEWLLYTAVFFTIGIYFVHKLPGLRIMAILMGMNFAVHSIRLIIKIRACSRNR